MAAAEHELYRTSYYDTLSVESVIAYSWYVETLKYIILVSSATLGKVWVSIVSMWYSWQQPP